MNQPSLKLLLQMQHHLNQIFHQLHQLGFDPTNNMNYPNAYLEEIFAAQDIHLSQGKMEFIDSLLLQEGIDLVLEEVGC